jgi:FKBP-type peptidyl-prolyl cis-trans isomerase SlyD
MPAPHKVLVLEYTLRDPEGAVIDQSEPDDPMFLHLERDQVVPGFEKAVLGLAAGDGLRFTVNPEEGYGPRDENLIQTLPRTMFPEDFDATPGTTIAFETEMGEGMLTVMEVEGDNVRCDFNHPLAGVDLDFEVKCVRIEEHDESECDFEEHEEGCGCGHHE